MVNKKLGKICMIGMPGSGKSTIGRALSDHLKFNFYDTDEQIELESQSRIKDIFINEGEDYFRKLERSIFKKLLLNRKEIQKIIGKLNKESLTLVPLKIYFNKKGIAKLEIALAKGKKIHDKRDAKKRKDWVRERKKL